MDRWEWIDRWSIDVTNRFGSPDLEGWYYGVSFDRLNESLKTCQATGVTNATSMVRKRRWTRRMQCANPEILDNIRKRIEQINQSRINIEMSLKDKENAYKAITFYEENRSFVFAQSLNLATHGTVSTLATLRELINKLKIFKQVSYQMSLQILFELFYLFLCSICMNERQWKKISD